MNNHEQWTVAKVKTWRGTDGEGFQGDLLLNGKRVAFFHEEGCGGEMLWEWAGDGTGRTIMHMARPNGIGEYEKRYRAFVNALPPEKIRDDAEAWEKSLYPDGERKWNYDTYIASLVDMLFIQRTISRKAKRAILYRLPGDTDHCYREWKVPPTPERIAKVLEKFPEAVILS